jgi:hypothetical protein
MKDSTAELPAATTEPVQGAAEASETPEAPEAPETPEAKAETPEDYEFTAPEGIELDPDLTLEFKGLAKDLHLPKDAAQKVVDLGAKLVQKLQDRHTGLLAEWAKASEADSEFGGVKLKDSLSAAKSAVARLGGEKLIELLDQTGLGNHPEVIRAFWKAGLMMKDDAFVASGAAPSAPAGARAMYPNSNMNP